MADSHHSAARVEDSFYPSGLPAHDQLSYYAQHFDTVEVDSTFYRTPSLSTVKGWYQKTPNGLPVRQGHSGPETLDSSVGFLKPSAQEIPKPTS